MLRHSAVPPACPAGQVWTLALFSIFSAVVVASKNRWDASLIMLCTQLPVLFVYHRCVAGGSSSQRAPQQVGGGLVARPPAYLCGALKAAPLPLPPRSNVLLRHSHYSKLVPLQGTLATPTADVDPATFLPPPLRKQAVGWYPEWNKVGCRMQWVGQCGGRAGEQRARRASRGMRPLLPLLPL